MNLLKILSVFTLSTLCLSAEVLSINAKIDDNETLESGDGEVSATVRLPKAQRIPFAKITVFGTLEKKAEANASLTLSIDGQEAAGRALYNKQGKFGANFVVTRQIRDAVKGGKESAELKLFMRGKNQSPVKINKILLEVLADEKYFRTSNYLRPLFSGDEITAESVFPLGNEDPSKPATAKLLFAPSQVLEAYTLSSGKKVDLVQDKDFKIDGDTIEFLPNSNVKIIPYSDIYAEGKNNNFKKGEHFYFDVIKKFAFFKEGMWFHSRMVYISYKHTAISGKPHKSTCEDLLPNTMKIIKSKKPLRVVLFGDSISYGANASGLSMTVPYAPSWGDTATHVLSRFYKTPVIFFNRALGGETSTWGVKQVENLVCPDKPDLVIIAFGMNDRIDKDKFRANLETIISKVRDVNPAAEFVLVSAMFANPNWHFFPMHDDYAEVCKQMVKQGIALADVRSIHKRLLEKKRFIDMTGNNVNHPNDFLIRVYAQYLLKNLIFTVSK